MTPAETLTIVAILIGSSFLFSLITAGLALKSGLASESFKPSAAEHLTVLTDALEQLLWSLKQQADRKLDDLRTTGQIVPGLPASARDCTHAEGLAEALAKLHPRVQKLDRSYSTHATAAGNTRFWIVVTASASVVTAALSLVTALMQMQLGQ